MRKGKKSYEEIEALRVRQLNEDFEFVDCNINADYELRPNWGKGKVRKEESEYFVVREADRTDMFDASTGTVQGNYVVKFYHRNMWKKMIEQEEKVGGSVFHGRAHEVLHDPLKMELEKANKPKAGRPKKTEE